MQQEEAIVLQEIVVLETIIQEVVILQGVEIIVERLLDRGVIAVVHLLLRQGAVVEQLRREVHQEVHHLREVVGQVDLTEDKN